MKYETRKEAARAWVGEFDSIPQSILVKLMEYNIDEVQEVTPVNLYCCYEYYFNGEYVEVEVVEINDNNEAIITFMYDGLKITMTVDKWDLNQINNDGFFPIWDTMWRMTDPCDIHWLEDGDGIQCLADCGFRIYEQEDYGYVFGINGAGYDFYEDHWIPLYLKRGLHWSKEDEEIENV